MKCMEPGVLECSDYYFSTPSGIAKKLFFYGICCGEFSCKVPYHVNRDSYNSYLLIQILDGSLTVKLPGEKRYETAETGELVWINCYQHHEYFTKRDVRFRFIHFDGNASGDFYREILHSGGTILRPADIGPYDEAFCRLVCHYRKEKLLTECEISLLLHTLLALPFQMSGAAADAGQDRQMIQQILDYIKDHYMEDLDVAALAGTVNLSIYYFSRMFKKETGYSPYEYLMHYRLDRAKRLLKNSAMTIREVGFTTGFKSESNFVACFHKNEGMSPGKFRKLPF
ncbi:helix-turn-helix domain-containing protein [Diplocloster agilis]|uniref:AraC family transcriptional regulator n=1 Tax=Diplocloster agilis TaxID=2850323 RepID=A0A949K058_9FIRM|nr:AraC family transcriptional regulator [Diplocloster agilis]MBU9738443.1 AraC family transcriptional regulator [Diplocloster agilis]